MFFSWSFCWSVLRSFTCSVSKIWRYRRWILGGGGPCCILANNADYWTEALGRRGGVRKTVPTLFDCRRQSWLHVAVVVQHCAEQSNVKHAELCVAIKSRWLVVEQILRQGQLGVGWQWWVLRNAEAACLRVTVFPPSLLHTYTKCWWDQLTKLSIWRYFKRDT